MNQIERLEERAKDAVSRLLIRQLILPKIYLEAPWPTAANRVDLLAIDRAGAGDVHVVEIKHQAHHAAQAVAQLKTCPAQFRWLAVFADSLNPATQAELQRELDAQPVTGRIGLIQVIRMAGDELGANVLVRAERSPGTLKKEVAAFAAANTPDIEYGEDEPVEGPDRYIPLSQEEIRARVEEVEHLAQTGFLNAAFVLVWGSAEAVIRLLAEREGLEVERGPLTPVVRSLKAYGVISDEDARVLMDAAALRNIVVHGFKSPAGNNYPVAALVNFVKKILGSLKAPSAA
jgi:hypothetical protein